MHLLANNRGLVHIALGDNEAALKDFALALVLMPNFLDARANRAGTLVTLGRFSEARSDIDAIAAIRGEGAVQHSDRYGRTVLDHIRVSAAIRGQGHVVHPA